MEEEEATLVEQLKRRQPAALERTIELYAAYVGAVVRNVIGDCMRAEDIEEVVSDAFVLLWNHAERIRADRGTLKSYLAAIARNQALKKRRVRRPPVQPLDDDVLVLDAPVDDSLERAERKRLIEGALSTMSELDREIFVRHYYFMERTAAIAERLGMKDATVRSRLSRGRAVLKQVLTEGGNPLEGPNLRPV